MRKGAFSILLTLLICVLLFTSVLAKTSELRENADSALTFDTSTPKAVRSPMRVCVEKMNYYKNESFEGSAVGTKKFGDIVYAEDAGNNVVCIYNKNGSKLGYCSASSLVDQNAHFFAEFPHSTDLSSGKVSKLVDLRKYILIFNANVTCDEESYVAIQYDTAIKLFRAAKDIYDQYGYTVNVKGSHMSDTCTCGGDHSTGGVLQLTITKRGENTSESIPLYENEGTPNQTVGKIAKVLADNSLIRVGESDCFADADNSSYMSTVIDPNSVTYSVWE